MLTDRQKEYLHLAARGYIATAIALKLDVADSTVRNMFSRIYGCMGVSNRAEAVARAVARGIITPPPAPTGENPLTNRQMEVITLLAAGYTYAQIGDELGITRDTVRNVICHDNSYDQGILGRLGAQSSAHAVAIAVGTGWIPVEGPPGAED